MNIANLLCRTGSAHAERPAIGMGPRPLRTYGMLARRVATLAANLRRRIALPSGERVALIMRNCPQYVEVMFAGWHAGLIVVPINARLHARELKHILEHSGAALCFVTPDVQAAAEATAELPGVRVIDVASADYESLVAGEPAPLAPVGPDEVAWLFYTSGTTGRPKGAMLTHRNLLAMTLSYFADVDAIGTRDCIVHAAPMSHGSGLYVLPHVAAGAAHVVPESGGFNPAELFDLMGVYPGMSLFAAPTMVRRLVDSPAAASAKMANLKTIVYGGGPMYLADCRRALDILGFKLAQIYGQGESPMTITALSKPRHAEFEHPRYEQRLASVGVAHTVVEVMVADGEAYPLPAGETGEVLVRGETVMRGYWCDPQASAEALRGGWLHTGDVGCMDEDGFLTLKDRSKDLIISGGTNIYPREVEEALLGHPAVAEVAVVGRPHPDWGEEVVAFVVVRPGTLPSTAELDAACLSRIARFKRPRQYRFVDTLPKNSYGKVLKTALREQFGDQP